MSPKPQNIDEIAAVCSSCGNCLFACPVYNAELIEPNSPRGKVNLVKALRDGRLAPNSLNKEFLYHCVLCGSCQHICTKGVEFTDMMVQYRNTLSGGKKIPLLKKTILFFYQSFLFKKFAWVVDILAKTPLRAKLGVPRRKKAVKRKLFSRPRKGKHYDILLFPGCVLTYFYPALIEKTVSLLEKKGFSVVVPRGLSCCGSPYMGQGWRDKFEVLKRKNRKVFSTYDFKYLVVPCGTGTAAFKKYYGPLDAEIYELTEFLYKFLPDRPIDPALAQKDEKITYHHPCHALKGLGLEKEPTHFMKQLGDHYAADSANLCCGFGGIFSVGFPRTSKKILKRKAGTIEDLGAQTVVTACPGCFMHLRENLPQEVKFFTELFE